MIRIRIGYRLEDDSGRSVHKTLVMEREGLPGAFLAVEKAERTLKEEGAVVGRVSFIPKYKDAEAEARDSLHNARFALKLQVLSYPSSPSCQED